MTDEHETMDADVTEGGAIDPATSPPDSDMPAGAAPTTAGGASAPGVTGAPATEPTDPAEAVDATDAFGDGPAPGLEHDARIALVTLMTQRFITRAKHPAAWDALLAYEDEIRERLDDLFLSLEVDRTYEVAFKRQVAGDGIPVLLRRDRALSRDASLLLIHLRQEHAYNDALDDTLVVSRDQVADFLNRFSPPGAHDQVQLDRRVDAAVRALEQYHLLEAVADAPDTLLVSPAVVPLVTTEVLIHLRDAYREATGRALGQPIVDESADEAATGTGEQLEPAGGKDDADSPEGTDSETAPTGDVDA